MFSSAHTMNMKLKRMSDVENSKESKKNQLVMTWTFLATVATLVGGYFHRSITAILISELLCLLSRPNSFADEITTQIQINADNHLLCLWLNMQPVHNKLNEQQRKLELFENHKNQAGCPPTPPSICFICCNFKWRSYLMKPPLAVDSMMVLNEMFFSAEVSFAFLRSPLLHIFESNWKIFEN